MKTIDCALAQDLMPLYTEGMLSPESREAPCWSRSFRRRPGCCAACGGGGRPCGRR